ncbi:MAG: hypothetical protein GY937_22965 [bacterium]|nr:hypothetical protein [bacterium]
MRTEYVNRDDCERVRLMMDEREQGRIYDALVSHCDRLRQRGKAGDWGTDRARDARHQAPKFELLRDTIYAADGGVVVSKRDYLRIREALIREARFLGKIATRAEQAKPYTEMHVQMREWVLEREPHLRNAMNARDEKIAAQ